MWNHIKGTIFAGIFTIVPLALTIYFLLFIFRFLDSLTAPILKYIGFHIPGVGILLTILSVYILGLIIRKCFGTEIVFLG